ncbi:hypothetical protein NDN08_002264 [Rhodosorus marinus]|uniref:Uncharacterized protein n=1 Tax=Rhodosorus marinus TaxID=101924 RepID=A0AAV8UTA6_9RHOD|nr:hypothetical protein NDN08_002264 [Rhodosorus marinus]
MIEVEELGEAVEVGNGLSVDDRNRERTGGNGDRGSDEDIEVYNGAAAKRNTARKRRFVFNAKADIVLLRLILVERPFAKEYGRMREAWKNIAEKLVETEILVDDRGARDRYSFLMKMYRKEPQGLRRLGTDEEFEIKEKLLASVCDLIRESKRGKGDASLRGFGQHTPDAEDPRGQGMKRSSGSEEDSFEDRPRKKDRAGRGSSEHTEALYIAHLNRLEETRIAWEKERLLREEQSRKEELKERQLDRREREKERLLREKQLTLERDRINIEAAERAEIRKGEEKRMDLMESMVRILQMTVPKAVGERMHE